MDFDSNFRGVERASKGNQKCDVCHANIERPTHLFNEGTVLLCDSCYNREMENIHKQTDEDLEEKER
jgi:hypothetical protein